MDTRISPNANKVNSLTLKSGAPVGDKLNSLLIGPHGPNLLADVVYLEEITHFNRERIPERVVHAKGAAAFGYFEVTNTSILKYSKASLFSKLGKRTPVVARFSSVVGESGYADTARDVRGFAVRFLTEEGNWDLVGNNLPVFFIRDPINFTSFIHSQKRNPKTHLKDPDAFWDFATLVPETFHALAMLFSERGIPHGFRHMHGFSVNTIKLVNAKKEPFYAKFHWICNQKIRNLDQKRADQIAGLDPDYMLRDLFINIEAGNHPSWTLKFQVMSLEEAEKLKFNVLDVTKIWPHEDYPLIELGQMTLDRNADNYFAQVEQLSFSPANMVPGIEPSPDKMLMGRIFAYGDAQRYRLGANFADLPCNRPKCPVMTPTYCDSVSFMSKINGNLPNYVPSISYKNTHLYNKNFLEHGQQVNARVGRYNLSQDDNYTQVRGLVMKVMGAEARSTLAKNIGQHLKHVVNKDITARALAHWANIDQHLAEAIEREMELDE